MPYNSITQLGNGATNVFSVNFILGTIDDVPNGQFNITCRVGDEPTDRTITWVSENMASIDGDIPGVGVPVVFTRSVTRTELISDFENDAVLIDSALNNASKQAIMIAMDALDGKIGPVQQNIDMDGHKFTNLPYGTDPEDSVNLQQVEELMETIPKGDQGPQGIPGVGVPSGGTTGQVLVKASNTNYDTTWGPNGIQSLVAGTNITIDNTNPAIPVISATGGGAATNTITTVASVAALKSVDGNTVPWVFLFEAYRWGFFQWIASNYTTQVSADPAEGLFIASNLVPATTGAWVRVGTWRNEGVMASWFGVRPDSNGTAGNGTNNTTALQNCLTTLQTLNNVSVSLRKIILPAGCLRFASTVYVTDYGVTIQGQGMGLPDAWPNPVMPAMSKGTWLFFDHTGIGIRFRSVAQNPQFGSRVTDVTTMRTHAAPGPGWVPTGHSADFSCYLHMVHFQNVGLLNPRIAFELNQSSSTFTHIRAQPLYRFVEANEVFDVLRFQDIHLWPYWSLDTNVGNYTKANLICFNLGRVDNPQFLNVFSIRQNIGIRLYPGTGGSTQRLKGSNVEFDIGGFGLVVTSGTDGLIAQLNNFVVFCDAALGINSRGVWIDGSNHNIHLTNVDISNAGAQAVLVAGTSNLVGLVNYRLYNYGEDTTNAAGIHASGTNCRVMLGGSEYNSSPNSVNKHTIGGTGNTIVEPSYVNAT